MNRHLPQLVFLSILAFAGGAFVLFTDGDWAPFLIYLPILILIATIFYKLILKPTDPNFPISLYILAFIVKLLGSLARYWMLIDLYAGSGDAAIYHSQGEYLASYFFKDLDFSVLEHFQVQGEGTTNMAIITGFVYSILPPSLSSSYLLFATLAFGGAVLFYCAFRIGLPEAQPNLYRFIIFFLPSVLFWPSSLGKDSWIFLGSGIVAYGLAKLMRQGRLVGLLIAAIGLLVIYPIRPHFVVFMATGLCVGYLIGIRRLFSQQHPVTLMAGGVLLLGIMSYVGPEIQNSFGINEISLEDIEGGLQSVQSRTTIGDSSYEAVSIFNPVGLALGVVTVIFRPFPWEAHNPAVLVTSLETLVWLGLVWTQRRAFWERVKIMHRYPFIAFLVFYSLITILAFTALGNFGILARQRVFFLPFFWMLFA